MPAQTPSGSGFRKSTFTLTFAIEIVGYDLWHDCNEGWIDLGPCEDGIRLQYELYPSQNFTIDIAIWPHAAKIICGSEDCWVRTWQYLERRWLTFSISHSFAVRVLDLQQFEASVTPNPTLAAIGASAKSDIPTELFIPPLNFGQRRYFGSVQAKIPTEAESLKIFLRKLVWDVIASFIPASDLDGPFDVPSEVKDIRHQDAILYHVQDNVLNGRETNSNIEDSDTTQKGKKADLKQQKYEIKLPGDTILAGTGRIIPFEISGEKPFEWGEIIVLISSTSLPASDDLPIVFVNVCSLFNAPLDELKKLNITHLYTRWSLGDEVHNSQMVNIQNKTEESNINFKDHHALPLNPEHVTTVTAAFLDDNYEVQLCGIRSPPKEEAVPKLFGFEKDDRKFGIIVPPTPIEKETDFVIAGTRIDARALAKGVADFINGEYPLYPLRQSVRPLSREVTCTNDMNQIGAPMIPQIVVPTSVILYSQMTLDVSMGVVGCRPPKLFTCFSRLYCIVSDSNSITKILMKIWELNQELTEKKEQTLTGFALDTGDVVVLFVEGPRDGYILKIWDLTEELYAKTKPVFSSSARYSSRIYSDLLKAMPFIVLKMRVPLEILLACPSVYARPALPIPARIAVLKLGRLIQNRYRVAPVRREMPTASELKSFRLELCAPPRAYPVNPITDTKAFNENLQIEREDAVLSGIRINWDKINKTI